ncbi:MAG: hypothetical protein K0B11_14060 [Mariniphaga sp.]|nr:hypothetical protein [Mariniphaga sp.]
MTTLKVSKKSFALRAFVIILLLVLLFAGRVNCQSAHHELSVSYGIQSTTELINNNELMDSFLRLFTLGLLHSETTNSKATGPVLFSWKYIPKSRWGFGVVAGRMKGSYDETIGSYWFEGKTVNHCKYSAFTLAPEIDFRYLQLEKLTLYSSAAVGLTFLSQEVNNSTEKSNYFDAHVSLIGLRYGQKLAAFAELGFGFKGLINFGVNLEL